MDAAPMGALARPIDLAGSKLVESQALQILPAPILARRFLAMLKIIGLQMLMTGLVMLVSGLWAGPNAALSALLGGAVCFIPNALLAVRLLYLQARGKPSLGVHTFFLGEAV
ncbi:MAG TPA: ATP synthase subunit I, partial [Burkholderiaceae bacterium]|nr:ATP synthase subunit I [Burkholderiaceae bacterium]